MRVMHVHRIRGIGGSERHLLTLLPALAERGVDPIFVGLDDPAWDAADFYGALQVPAVRIMSPRDFDPLLLVRLARTLRADIVHTHLVHADVYGGLAARLRGTHLVSTKHNDDPFRVGPFRFVERGLSRLTDRVVTITDALHRFTVDRVGVPADKVETIHYGLDGVPDAWAPTRLTTSPDEARVLVAVARLTDQKGIDVAIRALAALPDDTVLVVLGEGPERPALLRLARELGVEARVFLLGRVPDVLREWSRDAARAPSALGGLRPRRARGDACGSARRRDQCQCAPGARRRRRDRRARGTRRCPCARARSRAGPSDWSSAPQALHVAHADFRWRG